MIYYGKPVEAFQVTRELLDNKGPLPEWFEAPSWDNYYLQTDLPFPRVNVVACIGDWIVSTSKITVMADSDFRDRYIVND